MGCGTSNTEVVKPLREKENVPAPVGHAVARSLFEDEDSGRSKSEPGRATNLVADRPSVGEKNSSQLTHLRTNVTLVEHKEVGASQTDPHKRGSGDEHPPSSFKPHAIGDNKNSPPSAEIENTHIRTSLLQTKDAPTSKDEPPPGPKTVAKGVRDKAPPTSRPTVPDGRGESHGSHGKGNEDPIPKPGTIRSNSNLSSKPKPDTKRRNENIPTVGFETGSTGHPHPHRNYNTSHLDLPSNGENGKNLLSTVEPGSRDKNEQLSSSSKPDTRHANNKNLPPTQPNFKDDIKIDSNSRANCTQTKTEDKAIVRESVAKETEQSLRAGVEKAPSPAGETTLERVRREALEMHNVYRAGHGVPPLVLNNKISQYSQKWAERMAATQKFEHSPGSERPDYGENIYYSGSTNFKVENVKGGTSITAFYNEIKDYDFRKPGERKKNGGQIGHFTQVVWKNSKELGVGMATTTRGDMGLVYICCNYGPPGNYVGDFERNVLPPITNSKEGRTNSRGQSEKATSQRTNNKKFNQEPPGRKETALQRVRREVLEEHNARRQKFGVAPLTMNSKINTYGQKRAEQMAKTRKFEQSPRKARPNYGENIFMAGSETFKLENVIGSEVATVFCDGMEQNSNIASHFTHSWNSMSAGTTELAWKNSQQLGVGMATTKQGKIGYVYICCNYS